MRKEQSGDANETEKVAMRSVLGALGYLARESRPDLSGPVLTGMSVVGAHVLNKHKPGT